MTCECGFSNSPDANYCGGCARPMKVATFRTCSGCAREVKQGARFCEHCATPVDDGAQIVRPEPTRPISPVEPSPAPAQVQLPPRAERSGRTRVQGTVLTKTGQSIRIMPSVGGDPVEIELPSLRVAIKVLPLVQVGDELETGGVWKDGLIKADQIRNLKTHVNLYTTAQSGCWAWLTVLIMLALDGFAIAGWSSARRQEQDVIAIVGLIFGLITVWTLIIAIRGPRKPKDFS